jgi:hypothetical protein
MAVTVTGRRGEVTRLVAPPGEAAVVVAAAGRVSMYTPLWGADVGAAPTGDRLAAGRRVPLFFVLGRWAFLGTSSPDEWVTRTVNR